MITLLYHECQGYYLLRNEKSLGSVRGSTKPRAIFAVLHCCLLLTMIYRDIFLDVYVIILVLSRSSKFLPVRLDICRQWWDNAIKIFLLRLVRE